MNKVTMKETLFEHFSGRATPLQRAMIAEWLQQPANQLTYMAWLDEWERQHLQYLADEDTAFAQLSARIAAMKPEHTPADSPPAPVIRRLGFFGPSRWLIAASVTVILGLGTYLMRNRILFTVVETTYGETRRFTLPDGSEVTLNAHSSLRLPRFGFGDESRTVWLTGEAAFSVRHTATHQRFIVHTHRGLDVEVLGTEFNVYDRPGGTKVVLSKGAVQLNYRNAAKAVQQLRLKPGDAVSITASGRLEQSHLPEPAVSTAWREHRFVFKRTPVSEIADLLRDNYNLHVVLKNPDLANRTVSGSFQADNADEFLQVVAELLEINYKQKENTVTFFE
ncbi:FecR family protein [Arsenicibacter rosenii]|uniref:Iron dicitrate transport regulator FecR n=1 Tax=Arsenicibacter rosenii TaxID=1750698 RepID=A0A1S2VP53_9BACT|nr:FecR domain-containing protein [Arsenicibacter rosenii]OIN59956.1 hypothetical protein BLX24_08960 [Arsenicibacter rosenii]